MIETHTTITPVEIRGHSGEPIKNFADWKEYALPLQRRKLHWKVGRSACELGRVWTANGEPAVPRDLAQLLDSDEDTKGIAILSGITECETPLPFGQHGPRCHDLALLAEQDGRPITICIEAKADEPFGSTVAKELIHAKKRPLTKFPERLDWLTRSLLGLPAFESERPAMLSAGVVDLPYQLLSGIAGTLLEAVRREAAKAIFVIHEFRTSATEDAKLEANSIALNYFLRSLLSTNDGGSKNANLENGQLIGPIKFGHRGAPGTTEFPCHIPLFIGKIRTDLTA
jgi:hypothetical protein